MIFSLDGESNFLHVNFLLVNCSIDFFPDKRLKKIARTVTSFNNERITRRFQLQFFRSFPLSLRVSEKSFRWFIVRSGTKRTYMNKSFYVCWLLVKALCHYKKKQNKKIRTHCDCLPKKKDNTPLFNRHTQSVLTWEVKVPGRIILNRMRWRIIPIKSCVVCEVLKN